MDWDELPALFPGLTEPGRWLPLLERHAELIAGAAPRVRVSSVAPEEIVRRQYAESLEFWRIVREAQPLASSIVDVGSGGGFPGLVIAAVEPGLRVTLIEPLQKRAALLVEMAEALGLNNIETVARRAEDAGRRGPLRGSADIVSARAVAALPELLEYTAPFAAPGGLVAVAKGSRVQAEIASAATAMGLLGLAFEARLPMRHVVSENVSLVLLRKVAATPAGYPRRAGLPAKRPL